MSHQPRRRRRVAPCVLACTIALSACAGSGSSSDSTPPTTEPGGPSTTAAPTEDATTFPGATWQRTDPAAAGMDPAKLDEIAARAEKAGSTCLAVFRDGKLVEDWYWKGTKADTSQEVWSVTKSFTSTLVGIAQDHGKLDIDDKATTYIPAWKGTPSAGVTVQNLISNNSGRHFDLGFDNFVFPKERDQTSVGIGLGQDAAPGQVWAYNNAAIQTLSRVVKQATGMEATSYADKTLLEPIGMDHSRMTTDDAGNTLMYMGLQSTCLDMARFGHLFLNEGKWNGRQIVSKGFVDDATGHSSTELNGAYGYLFWLNRKGRIAGARTPATAGVDDDRPIRQVVPDAPEDMYWAAGIGGQTIQIDPGSHTIVTRIGPPIAPEGTHEFGRGETAKVVTEAIVDG